jgi:hypothetical protein
LSVRRLRDTERGRGNRCGHDPRAWRTSLARPRRRLPPVLSTAADVFHSALFDERGRFPELRRCLRKMQLKLYGANRRVLSERRSELLEVISLVMRALLCRMDILSKRVGWHPGRGWQPRGKKHHDFVGLPVQTIAKWTGRDESSVKRALRILRWVGWVPGPGRKGKGPWIIPQPVERLCPPSCSRHTRDCFEYKPGVRRISLAFFQAIGVDGLLEEAVEHKKQARAKERAERLAEVVPIRAPSRDTRPATISLVSALAAHVAYKPPD